VKWGANAHIEPWNELHRTADEMWAVGAAVTLTAIWRRIVDRVHPDGSRKQTLEEDIAGAAGAVRGAYARYRRNLLPLTPEGAGGSADLGTWG
jgi:hypothetical protein